MLSVSRLSDSIYILSQSVRESVCEYIRESDCADRHAEALLLSLKVIASEERPRVLKVGKQDDASVRWHQIGKAARPGRRACPGFTSSMLHHLLHLRNWTKPMALGRTLNNISQNHLISKESTAYLIVQCCHGKEIVKTFAYVHCCGSLRNTLNGKWISQTEPRLFYQTTHL